MYKYVHIFQFGRRLDWNKLWKMFWAYYSLENQNHGILRPRHPAVEEMKTAYLGSCYGKAEAGKSGEHHTHHQNRSPSKREKNKQQQ